MIRIDSSLQFCSARVVEIKMGSDFQKRSTRLILLFVCWACESSIRLSLHQRWWKTPRTQKMVIKIPCKAQRKVENLWFFTCWVSFWVEKFCFSWLWSESWSRLWNQRFIPVKIALLKCQICIYTWFIAGVHLPLDSGESPGPSPAPVVQPQDVEWGEKI